MRGQAVNVVVLIAMLALCAAEFTVGCGEGYVHGYVTQKISPMGSQQENDRQLVINGRTFSLIPVSFYNQVQVGDLVKFDGRNWTIEKKANAPQPASPSP